jgi:plastocyanin
MLVLKVSSKPGPFQTKGSATQIRRNAKAGPPALKFAEPDQNGKVEKNVDQVVDFVAVEAGTYEIKCAKLCGMSHGRMKGKLIVEE